MAIVDNNNVKIKFTINETNFLEILEKIESAKDIFISTLNFNDDFENDRLFNLITRLNADITIVTNIPKRFDKYFNNTVKKNAKNQIVNYLNNVSPSSFEGNAKIYFNYNNHSKIFIIDNSMAYIGSANFTDKSNNNYEGGVIIEDENAIRDLRDIIKRELINKSDRIAGQFELEELHEAHIILEGFVKKISPIIENIRECIDAYNNRYETPREFNYFDYKDDMMIYIKELFGNIGEFRDKIEDYCDLLNKYNDDEQIDIRNIRDLLKFFDDDNNLYEMLDFDRESCIDSYYNKYALEADDSEKLERLLDAANSNMFEEEERLFESLEESTFPKIEILVKTLKSYSDVVSNLESNENIVNKLIKNIGSVDNTSI